MVGPSAISFDAADSASYFCTSPLMYVTVYKYGIPFAFFFGFSTILSPTCAPRKIASSGSSQSIAVTFPMPRSGCTTKCPCENPPFREEFSGSTTGVAVWSTNEDLFSFHLQQSRLHTGASHLRSHITCAAVAAHNGWHVRTAQGTKSDSDSLTNGATAHRGGRTDAV